jgi:transposase
MSVIHQHIAGRDGRTEMILACVTTMVGAKVSPECRMFDIATARLLALLTWLTASGCADVGMEATGVYWKPV